MLETLESRLSDEGHRSIVIEGTPGVGTRGRYWGGGAGGVPSLGAPSEVGVRWALGGSPAGPWGASNGRVNPEGWGEASGQKPGAFAKRVGEMGGAGQAGPGAPAARARSGPRRGARKRRASPRGRGERRGKRRASRMTRTRTGAGARPQSKIVQKRRWEGGRDSAHALSDSERFNGGP